MSQKPINSIIKGWLSSLSLKQQGQNPVEVADQVVPTLQLEKWYNLGGEVVRYGTFLAGAGTWQRSFLDAGGNAVSVPSGKIWAVSSIGCVVAMGGANSVLQASVGFSFGGSATLEAQQTYSKLSETVSVNKGALTTLGYLAVGKTFPHSDPYMVIGVSDVLPTRPCAFIDWSDSNAVTNFYWHIRYREMDQ